MRRTIIGLSLLGLVAVLAVLLAHRWGVGKVEGALRAAEVQWSERRSSLGRASWSGLVGPGVQAERLSLTAFPQPSAQLEGLVIDIDQLGSRAATETNSGDASTSRALLASVGVQDMSVRWRGETVLSGLSGSLLPAVDLRGPDGTIRREDGRWSVELTRSMSLGPARGTTTIKVDQQDADTLAFQLDSADLHVEHPMLAARPLGPLTMTVAGSWTQSTGDLRAEATLGGLRARIEGTLQPEPLSVRLEMEAEDLPFEQVIALFGDQLPEARRARCRGSLGMSLTVQGPPLVWSARPAAEGLSCEGLLQDVDALRSGSVRWRARQADGSPRLAATGPGQPGFTSWIDGQRLADAFIASEDILFHSHPGYDLAAIQEAIDEAAAGEERPRGGSTITQQLAKNLYTGDDRTLLRKLRELMYTLELESTLTKRHILQLYINIVELGPDLHGVGPAADLYFAKDASGLTDKEAAFLATLLPSPVSGHGRASEGRVAESKIEGILSNLQRAGLRSPDQVAAARRQPLVLLVQPPTP